MLFKIVNVKQLTRKQKNKRTSKHLCQHHSKFIEVVCSYGNHTMKIKPRYFKGFEADYICNKCNIIKHNKSEKMREVSKKQGLKNVSANGSLYKYNQSEQHHKQAKINIQKALEWHKNNPEKSLKISQNGLSAYRNSESFAKHIQTLNSNPEHQKNAWDKALESLAILVKDPEWRKNHPNYLVFDRDEFYSSDLNLVSFKVNGDSDQNMSLSKFVNKYNKVGSVIARNLYSSDGCFICCLDVAKTNGTSGELSWFQRTMKKAKEQKNLSTEELSLLSNPSIRLKRRKYLDEMDKYPNSKIVSEVVFAFDHPVEVGSEEEKYLLNIEMQYAHDNKALFWNN